MQRGLGGDTAGRITALIKPTASAFYEREGMLTCVPKLICSSVEKAVCSPSDVRAILAPLFRKSRAVLVELLGDVGCGSYLIGEVMFISGAVVCRLVVCRRDASSVPDAGLSILVKLSAE